MSYKLTQTGQKVQELLDQIANGGQLQVTDAVLYTEQVLNENEQKQARKNIGAAAENQIPTGAVLYSQQQNLTGDQQAQARTNIGVPTKVSELENDAHYITENQVPVALPQKTGAIQSGVLPTTGWDILDEVGDEGWKENILPVSSDWDSVTYGDGKFVAVADGSANGIYSLDGVTWTEFTLPASRNWYSVTYGGGKFVAVADGTYGAYSTDGINWTEMTMPASRRWESVTYGNSQYVAIAYSSTYGAYSTDGINWTEMTMPADSEWESVIYGDGKFVAVAYDLYGAYSTDGINWTKMAMPSYHHWISVTYGNGKYIAVPYNNTSGAYSTDGINWTEFTLPIEGTWRVVYGNKKFVAVAERSSVCAYSTNGLTWTEMTMPANRGWYSVAYGDGKFVALAYDITFGAYWEVAGIPIYTISDTDITANSDILMELTDEGGARARTIASGSIQIIRGTVPTNPIPYTYKVKQTNASGQFTLVNHYVPNVPTKTSELTNDSGFIIASDIPTIPTSLPVTYKKVSGELPTSGWENEVKNFIDAKTLDKATYYTTTSKTVTIYPSGYTQYIRVTGWEVYLDGEWHKLTQVATAKYAYKDYNVSYINAGHDAIIRYEPSGVYAVYRIYEDGHVGAQTAYNNGDVQMPAFRNAEIISGQSYTITDTFITVNTSVKMYLTDEGDVKAQNKANGSITVIRDTVPTTSIPYKYEVEQTSNEGLFEVINSYVPSASPSIISKTITNTSSNISITGTSEPYLCTITDSDVTTTNFVRLYPLDEGTETWLNDNTSSSIITESSGKFTFKVTTNTLPQTFTMKYFIQ